MPTDPLSDIVRALDLTGAVFLNAEFTAPWAITAHVTEEDCRPFMPVPQQMIAYHVVVQGELLLSLDDTAGYRQHLRCKAGDIIFLPGNALHILASSEGQTPLSGDDLLFPDGDEDLVQIRHGGGGERTRILCGFVASNAGSSPLLESLPEVLIIGIESLTSRQWIEASVMMAAQDLTRGRLTHGGTISGLCQLLLTEALRVYVEQNPRPAGWLRGMAHPRIAQALSLIHGSLQNPPSVESLAARVGMSRSAFVERFSDVMGVSPRRYILAQRMDQAEMLLGDGQLTVAEIANRLGYDAPEAFSRAFKREHGRAPAEWRAKRATHSQ